MSARETVLASIRRNRPQVAAPLPDLPVFTTIPADGLEAEFKRRLAQMGGRLLEAGPAEDRLAPARAMIADAASNGIVCSMVEDLPGNRSIAGLAPASAHDVDLVVLRACFAVAETGSVALRDRDLGLNALGYLAQRLLILVDPETIVENLSCAYRRPEFIDGHYLVLQTGPSATADIEGVLIHGAQGVRALTVCLYPDPAAPR